jgi:hypothetical protein
MGAVAFVAPFLPGKVEDHRRFCDELVGSRREEYEASRRRLGIKRESAWHQETPAGTVSVVYIEADDPGSACRAWAPRPTRLTNGFGRAFWIFTASTSPTRRDHHPSRFSTTAPNESASRRSLERNVVLCVSQPAKCHSPAKGSLLPRQAAPVCSGFSVQPFPWSAPRRLGVSAPVTHQGRSLELVCAPPASDHMIRRTPGLRLLLTQIQGPLIPQLVWAHIPGVTH